MALSKYICKMNEISNQKVFYFRASRTLEIFFVAYEQKHKIFFLYNYEGMHYRLFENKEEVRKFFNYEDSEYLSFEDEEELDFYLLNYNI